MNTNLHRSLAALAVVLFFAAVACEKSNPVRPSAAPSMSEAANLGSVVLSNLTGMFVGTADEMCNGKASVAIDDLKVDYSVSGRSLLGSVLVACQGGDCQGGTVIECPAPPNPCEARVAPAVSERSVPACLVGDPQQAGSVRVFAAGPADREHEWNVMAYDEETGARSNTLSTIVEQIQP